MSSLPMFEEHEINQKKKYPEYKSKKGFTNVCL